MFKFTVLLLVLAGVSAVLSASLREESQQGPPTPYAWSYTADSVGGQSSHSEQSDGNGRVTGFYTILGADGRERRVEYIADENGYRATIQTNEVGTKADSAANAEFIVSAPSEGQMRQANAFQQQQQQRNN